MRPDVHDDHQSLEQQHHDDEANFRRLSIVGHFTISAFLLVLSSHMREKCTSLELMSSSLLLSKQQLIVSLLLLLEI